jgi:Bacterial Ig domain
MSLLFGAVPASHAAEWTGGSATTSLWSDPANWSGSPPGPDEYIVFTAGSGRRTNINDLVSSLDALYFGDSPYLISGNTVTMSNLANRQYTLEARHPSGVVVWDSDLVLAKDESFLCDSVGSEVVIAELDLHGNTASFYGHGTNVISATLRDSVGRGGVQVWEGLFVLDGANVNFTSTFAPGGGTTLILGSYPQMSTFWVGGTLGGTGDAGDVSADSDNSGLELRPGDFGRTGTLTTRDLRLDGPQNGLPIGVFLRINGTNASADYDQIVARGDIVLGLVELKPCILPSLSLPVGTTFTLIHLANSSKSFFGEFFNQPEGTIFTTNSTSYRLSYAGGAGHDVTLTVVSSTRTWSGLSPTTANWSDTNNWVGGARPVEGDSVVFPADGQQRFNANDLVSNLNSVTFGGGGYFILGNTVSLSNGITATNASGDENVWAPLLALAADQAFTSLTPGTTLLLSQLDLNGRGATFAGPGTNILANVLQDSAGGGGLTNSGTGTFLFSVPGGGSSFSGPMALTSGTNLFAGVQQRSPILWTGGTLGGTGLVGSVTAAGLTPKKLTPGYANGGTLGLSNLVLNSAVKVAWQINGSNAQTDFGQLLLSGGTADLGSATLSVALATNVSPTAGTSFPFLLTDPRSLISGTFSNLPEGALFLPTNSHLGVRISYFGGAGHDVVLTVQSNQPPVFATPTNTVFFNVLSNNAYANAISDLEMPVETFSWTNLTALPPGLALNPNTGRLTWAPATNQAPSTNVVLVAVTDSGTPPMSATGQVTIIVRPLNQAPVPVPVTATNVVAGHTLTIQLRANDPDTPPDPAIWSAVSLPPGASITTDGLFSYSPAQSEGGTKTCTFSVHDFNPDAANPTSPNSFLTFSVQVIRNSVVINTLDSGLGSLRWAITNIAADPNGGHIEFNIPGDGSHKIAPLTPLPGLGPNTYLDGYTQPGAQPNTNPVGTGARIMIELSGENHPGGYGLTLGGSGQNNITVRGLCINRFVGGYGGVGFSSCCGSDCGGSGGNAVEGCFIGTDTSGMNALPNSGGIAFSCMYSSRVGGPAPDQRNLISGNTSDGVDVGGHFSGTSIQNNLIGTDRTGTNALGNGSYGLALGSDGGATGCLVADNVICASGFMGLRIEQTRTLVVRNKIGLGADGVTPLGNGDRGIYDHEAGTLIGGTNTADANYIAYNHLFGVDLAGLNDSALGNVIFRNASRGLYVATYANNSPSAPVLTSASLAPGGVAISGTLTSQSNTVYRLEFFQNLDFLPNNQPQAWFFLGATNVTTDSSSNASFSITFSQLLVDGFVTATATDPSGDTSSVSDGLLLQLPRLNIGLTAGQVRLLWLTNFSGFILQSNSRVVQPLGWADVPGNPGITGSNFFRDFPPASAEQFFRLRSQ